MEPAGQTELTTFFCKGGRKKCQFGLSLSGLVKQALLVVGNIPLAVAGGIAALWIRGINLNVSASIEFLALFGAAILNGIVRIRKPGRLKRRTEND